MPTWDEILQNIAKPYHENLLKQYVKDMSDLTGHTTIAYISAFTLSRPRVPSNNISIVDQDMQGFMTCANGVTKENLDLIIHTPGGEYEATKRLVSYLHRIFGRIRVFIPHLCFSGGTIIACSADEIYMGPYSSLGPTDPQIFNDGAMVPVGALISEFEEIFNKVKADPATAPLWNERLKSVKFGVYNSALGLKERSEEELAGLLQQRNCKNKEKAEEIAKYLNSHDKHSTHGKGINLEKAQELGLNVYDLSENKELEDKVLSIYHAAIITFQYSPNTHKFIMNNQGKSYFYNFQVQQ
ncbi:SDH family Clp fold serine proteinase [Limisalsivibrio acetivorans]|uniref:SDH family Clp fold serine proteinase n=1 Tax=Limisalsivibrio acetivorans TaxID=1304888 RepID=UPI0003B5774C|nr:hypothetical protein [Limisalsivibrio acetivorans]